MSDPLGYAALDPNAAAGAPMPALPTPEWTLSAAPPPPPKRHELTLAAYVDKPRRLQRWRFFIFWLLLKLAARVYRFDFEIYRNEETPP